MITTEALITSDAAFDIETATPCQIAACRILDGLPLGELAADPDVIKLVGGVDALSRLPSEQGQQPQEVVFLAAVRSLKTMMACAAAIRMTQTVDLRGLKVGETPRVSIVSVKLDNSNVAFRILSATIDATVLRELRIGEPTNDTLVLRHPSGRPIEICCVAGAKAGSGLVSRWSAGVIFDEAPRMVGAEDGVVNLDDARSAVLGRLLPGAQALYIGSPWAPFGPVYDMVQEFWRAPNSSVVVLRGTGPMLNPYWWTEDRCARLEQQDPIAYRTDVLGEFADPETALFSSDILTRQTREGPVELEYDWHNTYVAAIDPATRGNAWTLIVATCVKRGEHMTKKTVVLARQWIGSRLAPLSPEAVFGEIAEILAPYQVVIVKSDQWAADALRDIARRVGLTLIFEDITAAKKLELYEGLRVGLEQGDVELAPVPLLREDLIRVRKRLTPTGFTIVLPTTGDGRHADYASALTLAVSQAIAAPADEPLPSDEQSTMKREKLAEVQKLNRAAWQKSPMREMRKRMGLN
jgi:hypothetical protein